VGYFSEGASLPRRRFSQRTQRLFITALLCVLCEEFSDFYIKPDFACFAFKKI
jgi:hypothetical protein